MMFTNLVCGESVTIRTYPPTEQCQIPDNGGRISDETTFKIREHGMSFLAHICRDSWSEIIHYCTYAIRNIRKD